MRNNPCPVCDDTFEYAGEACVHSFDEPREPTGYAAAYALVVAIFTLGLIVGFLIGC